MLAAREIDCRLCKPLIRAIPHGSSQALLKKVTIRCSAQNGFVSQNRSGERVCALAGDPVAGKRARLLRTVQFEICRTKSEQM